ncbi:LysR substrate-binding domain-containing protein [Aestuariispira ectoiniformans]|uniref:LysR substrate-binding domain-containing protein n=1 Tax=Aestuariispira ectoiniformans TaxID=2775080 RepID=UPI00223B0D56|nr:LysR substrate-binding domain-containing protein [Aestuariispira ectoiniformans]
MDLPPLNALKGFEAAARTGSFSQAGDELCVTHAAISHQIKQLEEWFGRPLFLRTGRGVELTPLGQALGEAVSAALGDLSQACRKLRAETERASVSVGCIPSIASRWLVPNLQAFSTAFPDIDIQVSYAHSGDPRLLNRYDVVITHGAQATRDAIRHRLFSRLSKPVCSPGYLDRHGPFPTAESILAADLLHDEGTAAWEEWGEKAGAASTGFRKGPVFQDFNLLVTAAIAGHGIALCPVEVFQAELERGDLVILSETAIQENDNYFAVTTPTLSPAAKQFLEWFTALTTGR